VHVTIILANPMLVASVNMVRRANHHVHPDFAVQRLSLLLNDLSSADDGDRVFI
jgi:hypothetical protein